MIPSAYALVLLALAVFRTWKLLGDDRVLDRPRGWLLDRIDNDTLYWTDFVVCPWCLGAWATILWWGAWLAFPHAVLVVAVPFAISGIVGYLGTTLTKLG